MLAASTPAALAVTALKKSVPGGRLLFSGLDLTLGAGEVVAIMGESGVGKSTLLNLVAGLDAPDSGAIAIAGVVFQAFHILPHLNLAQNVALPLVLARVPGAEALARAEAMLAAVGVGGRGRDYPAQLSGGELQRVAI